MLYCWVRTLGCSLAEPRSSAGETRSMTGQLECDRLAIATAWAGAFSLLVCHLIGLGLRCEARRFARYLRAASVVRQVLGGWFAATCLLPAVCLLDVGGNRGSWSDIMPMIVMRLLMSGRPLRSREVLSTPISCTSVRSS